MRFGECAVILASSIGINVKTWPGVEVGAAGAGLEGEAMSRLAISNGPARKTMRRRRAAQNRLPDPLSKPRKRMATSLRPINWLGEGVDKVSS